jgi:pimeloyl-ACP methyl ester carboxylesterase
MWAVIALVAGTLVGQSQAPPPAGAPADSAFWIEPAVFASERGDSVPAERGHLRVPENRSREGGRTIELTFLRFRATGTSTGAPIVYLAGGPGGSAQLVARGARFPAFMRLREAGDVIVLDQRGTWGSGDLLCPAAAAPAPDSVPGTEENQLEAWRRWSGQCVRHWSEQGVDLAAYNTMESADDLESLRAALAVPRLSLWAISYGTQLAQAYLRRHPDRVERMILAGPEPLAALIKRPSQSDRQIARLDSALRSDPDLRARIPDLRALVASVHRALEARPVRATVRGRAGDSTVVGIGSFDVRFLTAFSLGNGAFMRQLPKLYVDMAAGDYSGIAPFVLRLRRYNTTAMALTMDCATGADPAVLAEARAEAPGSLFGMAANFPFPELCDAWPHRELGDEFRRPVRSAVPTLFIAGTMDGRTPPSNVVAMRGGLPNAATLLVVGAAHDDDLVVSDPGIAEAMLRFLRGAPGVDAAIQLAPWRFAPVRAGAP